MSTLSLRLPESLHRRLAEVAERDGVSSNLLISSAVAEKMSALLTGDLEARAKRVTRAKFSAALAKVPGREPETSDRVDVRAARRAAPSAIAADQRTPRRRRTRARR